MKLPALIATLCCCGCLHYAHDQYAFGPDGKLIPIDHTRLDSFIYTGQANKIRSEIKQTGTNFTRVVSVGSIQGAPDNEFIKAIASGAAEGAIIGASKAAKPLP